MKKPRTFNEIVGQGEAVKALFAACGVQLVECKIVRRKCARADREHHKKRRRK